MFIPVLCSLRHTLVRALSFKCVTMCREWRSDALIGGVFAAIYMVVATAVRKVRHYVHMHGCYM